MQELFTMNYVLFLMIKLLHLGQEKGDPNCFAKVKKMFKTMNDLAELKLRQHLEISNKFVALLMMILILQ